MAAAQRIPEPAAPAVHTPSKAKFVTVASKLPMHIEIQLCTPKTARVTGQFGSVEEVVHVRTGKTYVIRGIGYPQGTVPKGFPKAPTLIEDEKGGYALTKNIPGDFWATWLEQNKDTDLVLNGLIKAEADLDSLADAAAEHAKQDSGLGPLDVEDDGNGRMRDRRAPQPVNMGISPIQKDDRAAA